MTKTFSNRWAAVNLDCQTEHEAALATVHFLETVREALLSNKQSVHKLALQVAFSDFDSKHLEFILATVGSGEVRAELTDSKSCRFLRFFLNIYRRKLSMLISGKSLRGYLLGLPLFENLLLLSSRLICQSYHRSPPIPWR